MSEKNPTKEIFFYKHLHKKIGYVLMSLKIDKEEFADLFPETEEITQTQLDELVDMKYYKVVFVGDDAVIDKHFPD